MRLWGSSSWGEAQKTRNTVSSMSVWLTAISPASGIRSGMQEGINEKCCLTKGFTFLQTEMEVMRRESVEYKGSNKEK